MTKPPVEPFLSDEKLLTALCVWRESRGVPYAAKLGVVWTLRNRCGMAPAQGFRHSLTENVLKPWAFSSFNANDPNSGKYPDLSKPDAAWLDCLRAVEEGTNPQATVPDTFLNCVFYWSPPLIEAPKAWGPVSEVSCLGSLHFCALSTTALPALSPPIPPQPHTIT